MNARPSDAEIAQAQRESGWTELRTRVVGELFNSGLSAAKCACLIGGVTRNAVIGKITRDDLSIGEARPLPRHANLKSKGTYPKPPRPPRSTPQLRRAEGPPSSPEREARKQAPSIVDAAIPVAQRRQLDGLNARCCRWPVGDPGDADFFFCGGDVLEDGKPYCPAHMRRAHDTTPRAPLKPSDRRLHKVSRHAFT